MRRLTAVIISVVLAISVPLIYLSLFIYAQLQNQQQQPPPLPSQIVAVSSKKYIVREPLSWAEVYKMLSYGQASYRFILPYGDGDLNLMYSVYMYYEYANGTGCQKVKEMYVDTMGYDDLLVRDNCSLLKLVMFGTERSWYPTLAVVTKLADKVPVSGDEYSYSVWGLIYFENGSMVAEFFDLSNPDDASELSARLRSLVSGHPVFVVLTFGRSYGWWYEEYKMLVSNNTPFAILFDARGGGPQKPQLDQELAGYGTNIYEVAGVVYKDGEIYAVWSPSFGCRSVTIRCSTSLAELLAQVSSGR